MTSGMKTIKHCLTMLHRGICLRHDCGAEAGVHRAVAAEPEKEEMMLRTSLLSRLIVLCLLGAGAGPMNAQNVSVWLTTDDQKTLMQPQSLVSFPAGPAATAPTIFVSENQVFQSIEGFGASMTDSAAFLLNEKVPSAALVDVMTSLFDRTRGIGISFLRNPMGASDLARYDYSYDDIPRSEEHTSELQSPCNLVCRLLL